MARGKGGAKGHGQERPNTLTEKERQICPLCIEPLDPTEKRFFPCPCGYQVCLFCFRRLKEEFSNQCPGCRTVYGSDFDPGRRLRNEAKQDTSGHGSDFNAVPQPGSLQRPVSPAIPVMTQQQQQQPQKHLELGSEQESPHELRPIVEASPLAPIAVRQHQVQVDGNGPQQQQPSALLQLSQGAPVTPDPDGAALLASTQQRVANGGLSVREAARLLVSFLRAKQAAADSTSARSSFYSNGLPGGMNGGPGLLGEASLRGSGRHNKGISFRDGFPEQRTQAAGAGLQGGNDGGLLSSLLGESQGGLHTGQGPLSWGQQQQHQPQPDDDLMRLLWGNQQGQQGGQQLSWTHSSPANGMDGHVPLYARARNGMHTDAARRWENGDKLTGMHDQNGYVSSSAWMSSAPMSSELAAIAMSAPSK